MATVSVENNPESVSELFDEGFQIYKDLDVSDDDNQEKIRKCIKNFEESTKMVSLLGMFSKNESVEEVATSDLKFFLLPFLLGQLTLKLATNHRLEAVEAGEVYFKDFVQRCQNYTITKEIITGEHVTPVEESEQSQGPRILPASLHQTACERNEKVRRYRERKEFDLQLQELQDYSKTGDEEITRNYYLILIRKYVLVAIEEMDLIITEKGILQYMASKKDGDGEKKKEKKFVHKPINTVIITRDDVQKKIYGAGYPSLPVMSVEDFYEQRVADGTFPSESNKPNHQPVDPDELDEANPDDEAELHRVRNMDEWKDNHRRGFGNRHNRS